MENFSSSAPEVARAIFSFLEVGLLCKCRTVSRCWQQDVLTVLGGLKRLDLKSEWLLTDSQLESVVCLCPQVESLEIDCFLLTATGAQSFSWRPSSDCLPPQPQRGAATGGKCGVWKAPAKTGVGGGEGGTSRGARFPLPSAQTHSSSCSSSSSSSSSSSCSSAPAAKKRCREDDVGAEESASLCAAAARNRKGTLPPQERLGAGDRLVYLQHLYLHCADGIDDNFIFELARPGGMTSRLKSFGISSFGRSLSDLSLSSLGSAFVCLESLSIETGSHVNANALVRGVVGGPGGKTLRHLQVTDLDRATMQAVADTRRKELISLHYTRASSRGVRVCDDLLEFIALRFSSLRSLKIGDVMLQNHQRGGRSVGSSGGSPSGGSNSSRRRIGRGGGGGRGGPEAHSVLQLSGSQQLPVDSHLQPPTGDAHRDSAGHTSSSSYSFFSLSCPPVSLMNPAMMDSESGGAVGGVSSLSLSLSLSSQRERKEGHEDVRDGGRGAVDCVGGNTEGRRGRPSEGPLAAAGSGAHSGTLRFSASGGRTEKDREEEEGREEEGEKGETGTTATLASSSSSGLGHSSSSFSSGALCGCDASGFLPLSSSPLSSDARPGGEEGQEEAQQSVLEESTERKGVQPTGSQDEAGEGEFLDRRRRGRKDHREREAAEDGEEDQMGVSMIQKPNPRTGPEGDYTGGSGKRTVLDPQRPRETLLSEGRTRHAFLHSHPLSASSEKVAETGRGTAAAAGTNRNANRDPVPTRPCPVLPPLPESLSFLGGESLPVSVSWESDSDEGAEGFSSSSSFFGCFGGVGENGGVGVGRGSPSRWKFWERGGQRGSQCGGAAAGWGGERGEGDDESMGVTDIPDGLLQLGGGDDPEGVCDDVELQKALLASLKGEGEGGEGQEEKEGKTEGEDEAGGGGERTASFVSPLKQNRQRQQNNQGKETPLSSPSSSASFTSSSSAFSPSLVTSMRQLQQHQQRISLPIAPGSHIFAPAQMPEAVKKKKNKRKKKPNKNKNRRERQRQQHLQSLSQPLSDPAPLPTQQDERDHSKKGKKERGGDPKSDGKKRNPLSDPTSASSSSSSDPLAAVAAASAVPSTRSLPPFRSIRLSRPTGGSSSSSSSDTEKEKEKERAGGERKGNSPADAPPANSTSSLRPPKSQNSSDHQTTHQNKSKNKDPPDAAAAAAPGAHRRHSSSSSSPKESPPSPVRQPLPPPPFLNPSFSFSSSSSASATAEEKKVQGAPSLPVSLRGDRGRDAAAAASATSCHRSGPGRDLLTGPGSATGGTGAAAASSFSFSARRSRPSGVSPGSSHNPPSQGGAGLFSHPLWHEEEEDEGEGGQGGRRVGEGVSVGAGWGEGEVAAAAEEDEPQGERAEDPVGNDWGWGHGDGLGGGLVSVRGLGALRRVLPGLRCLHLSRGGGLPFCEATEVELLQAFSGGLDLLRMEEVELCGFVGLGDATVFELLSAGGAATETEGAESASGRGETKTVEEGEEGRAATSSSGGEDSAVSSAVWMPPFGQTGRRGTSSRQLLHGGLSRLALENCRVTDVGLQSLAAVVGECLAWVSVKRCRGVGEGGLSALLEERGSSLLSLNLGGVGSHLTDRLVRHVGHLSPRLESLVLNDSGISDKSLRVLGGQLGGCLKELAVHRCEGVTDAGLVAVGRLCPLLVLVSFSRCRQVTDAGVCRLILGCRRLQKLRLDATEITDLSVEFAASTLRQLRHLHLNRCPRITSACLRFFSSSLTPRLKCVELGSGVSFDAAVSFSNPQSLHSPRSANARNRERGREREGAGGSPRGLHTSHLSGRSSSFSSSAAAATASGGSPGSSRRGSGVGTCSGGGGRRGGAGGGGGMMLRASDLVSFRLQMGARPAVVCHEFFVE
uniref:F-box domain-containing protein n=1 Tax=Chromera velia CCMP2878 TaxID=1169474 RepID=A0A0G4H348_9ALVE|eukprot:Cvel_5628.t1-p1 / transcript=Cvel_5628.t1 / gene=Cvel_5628 / organism=Chromera_velia_CCMP2878 / gene_product=F-box/LRR-repeat protein 16, putative / transcript_product=F-box/LRR-repeat protein 16, putative / location=Cvel_scaffold265:49079-59836(+) / protein_length=1868 / sequence_SO=supercontig / SO=protein_coding / is_pseudo=false